jgi:hypothetical protein
MDIDNFLSIYIMTEATQFAVAPEARIQTGYKLGFYKMPSGRIKEAILQVETLPASKLIDQRCHEVYDLMKTDLMKINKIETIAGEKLETAFLTKKPELKYDIKVGEIIRFKHSDFTETIPDVSYFTFYTTRIGALNQSKEVASDFTGSLAYYYDNGKLKEKHHYANGIKVTVFGYYDNSFNALNYSWQFDQQPNQTFPMIREYIYSIQENPIAQYLIHEGKIVNQNIYNVKGGCTDSIYLKSSEL